MPSLNVFHIVNDLRVKEAAAIEAGRTQRAGEYASSRAFLEAYLKQPRIILRWDCLALTGAPE